MYQELLDEAMLGIVKKVLSRVQFDGLTNDQSFYISFCTEHSGVIISDPVRLKYPKEITIILQYQFRNLQVFDDKFKVNIAFGGIPETIHVPFSALTSFVDPSANFSLQFRSILDADYVDNLPDEIVDHLNEYTIISRDSAAKIDFPQENKKCKKPKKKPGKVIAIDDFRRKKK